jgi:hypothetical protein
MTLNRRWTLPLVLAAGAAIGAALTVRRRAAHHDAKRRQHTEGLQAWEGEGGNLATPAAPATPATAQHGP